MVTSSILRNLQSRELAAHVVGFVGHQNQALEGIERAYDEWIQGEPGTVLVRKRARGGAFATRLEKAPTTGATVELTLVAAPKPGRDDVRNLAGQHPLDGARVSNIGPSVADELGIDETGGVAVMSVRRASTAARLGFLPGDVIAEINGQPVETVLDVEELLAKRQRMWLIAVRRGDKVFNLQVPG